MSLHSCVDCPSRLVKTLKALMRLQPVDIAHLAQKYPSNDPSSSASSSTPAVAPGGHSHGDDDDDDDDEHVAPNGENDDDDDDFDSVRRVASRALDTLAEFGGEGVAAAVFEASTLSAIAAEPASEDVDWVYAEAEILAVGAASQLQAADAISTTAAELSTAVIAVCTRFDTQVRVLVVVSEGGIYL